MTAAGGYNYAATVCLSFKLPIFNPFCFFLLSSSALLFFVKSFFKQCFSMGFPFPQQEISQLHQEPIPFKQGIQKVALLPLRKSQFSIQKVPFSFTSFCTSLLILFLKL